MRILIVTNHFFPESFRVNDVAEEMVRTGHDVTVLTAIPDYPKGHFFKGYGYIKRRRETVNGVKVIRAAVIPRGKGGAVRMLLNYISVFISFIANGWLLARRQRFDYVFVHDTSPAFICYAATIVKRRQHCPLDIWILDMWPESLVAGGITNKRIYSLIQRMMDYFYRQADVLHISSHGFRQMLLKRNVENDKIRYLPNWADSVMGKAVDIKLPTLPDGFIIMFAGNLGNAQNLELVLQAAKLTATDKQLHWVFVGDGRKCPWMESFVRDNQLGETVHLLGRYPIETMPMFFQRADVMLVSLANKPTLNMTLPAKVQAYMSNGKPILAMLNGEGQDIVKAARCGCVVNADDVKNMAYTARLMKNMPKDELTTMGNNGRSYYERNFSKKVCMDEIASSIKKYAESGNQR